MLDDSTIELKYQQSESFFDWAQVFGNAAPINIEIGFGKCGFLLSMAADCPAANFVGIETSRKYYRKGIRKVQRAGLENVKLMLGDACHLLSRYVPDESVVNFYVNCPDPWPKKRHAKRRLFNQGFVEIAAQKLAASGCFALAMDIAPYMDEALLVLRGDARLEPMLVATSRELAAPRAYTSEYEREFLNAGKIMQYATFRKTPTSAA